MKEERNGEKIKDVKPKEWKERKGIAKLVVWAHEI